MRETTILLAALFAMASSSGAVNLGVYDFNRTFRSSNTQAFEHVFISWARYKTGAVYSAMDQAQSQNRWLLLSLEPWADPTISPNPSTLLADVVDFVGCSLYSWSAYNIPHGYDGSFKGLFDPKYARIKVHGKPVMVCECGVEKGDDQAAWVAAAKAVFSRYPRLTSVVYFNCKDTVHWWPDAPLPDWSISPTIFHL